MIFLKKYIRSKEQVMIFENDCRMEFKKTSKITYLIASGNIKLKKSKKIPVHKINFA